MNTSAANFLQLILDVFGNTELKCGTMKTENQQINLRGYAISRLREVADEKRAQIALTTSTQRLQCLYGVNGPREMSNGVLAVSRPQINAEIAAIKSAAQAAPKRVWFSKYPEQMRASR